MKYYFLKNSSKVEEIGNFPQCETCVIRGKLNDLHLDNLDFKVSPDVFPIPLLHKKSKLTTLIDASVAAPPMYFLTVRKELIEMLERFEIGQYHYWQIEIEHKKKILQDYFLFYLDDSHDDQIVDYNLSSFFTGNITDWRYRGSNLKISDRNDYKETLNSFRSTDFEINIEKLILDFRNARQDLIRITEVPFGKGYYISEKIKKEVLLKNFTGMEFIPIEELTKNRVKFIF